MEKQRVLDKLKQFFSQHKMAVTLCIIISVAAPAGFVVGYNLDSIIDLVKNGDKRTRLADVADVMLKTKRGTPVTLGVSEKNPLDILISSCTYEERQAIIDCITDLNHYEGIEFNVLNTDDVKVKSAIYVIPNCDDIGIKDHTLGNTSFIIDERKAEFSLPITITLSSTIANYYKYVKYDELKAVFKHEMGHALGRNDLYDEKWDDQSLMYSKISYLSPTKNYTEFDDCVFRKVYSNDNSVTITYPTEIKSQVIYDTNYLAIVPQTTSVKSNEDDYMTN